MKLLSKETVDDEEIQRKQEMKEMVAFLLNQAIENANVALITDRLLKKVYTTEFNQFVIDKDALAADYAHEVREKKMLIDLYRTSDMPKSQEMFKVNYLLRYYQECKKRKTLPLPILLKVRDGKLVLKHYHLNTGLCESLADSLCIYPTAFHSINLTNNGI